jgi:hypothetical protein
MNYFKIVYIAFYGKVSKQSLWVDYGMILINFEIKWIMNNPKEK